MLVLPACSEGHSDVGESDDEQGVEQQSDADACVTIDAKLAGCGLVWTQPGGICAQAGGPCLAECALSATCDEIEGGNWSMETLICFMDCEPRQVCADGSATIRVSWVCDFEQDCLDGSDEVGCVHFRCDDGTGVPDAYLCDGDLDCPGGEDEWDPC